MAQQLGYAMAPIQTFRVCAEKDGRTLIKLILAYSSFQAADLIKNQGFTVMFQPVPLRKLN